MLHSDTMLWIREQHDVVLEQQTCQLFVRLSWTRENHDRSAFNVAHNVNKSHLLVGKIKAKVL